MNELCMESISVLNGQKQHRKMDQFNFLVIEDSV